MNDAEHNPDGLTPEQYGAPEGSIENCFNYAETFAKSDLVVPLHAAREQVRAQSARIAELERRVEELTEDAVNTQRVLDDTLVSNGKRIATAETQVSQLRAQVETLTKERDEARMDAESKRQVTAIALEEHEKLRAQLAARAQEEQP